MSKRKWVMLIGLVTMHLVMWPLWSQLNWLAAEITIYRDFFVAIVSVVTATAIVMLVWPERQGD